ncbi:MAG: sigma-70 family RNA polymerase sigma factor [Planctomycetales bacterium]|nr:sigma-70 family RNA polymerase sigma factor [Planctomycetales bacterium]
MATIEQSDTIQTTVVQLVLAAQAGDRSAMGDLFVRYKPHVLAVAMRRLRDEAEAQELCQEVFVQVLQKLPQLRQPECFVGWLTSITKRMAINKAVRRPPTLATEPQTLEATCIDRYDPESIVEASERAACVHDGLGRLKEMDRATLVAFYVRGQSLLEMSRAFQAPIGTIKRRLFEARKRLAKEVESLAVA